MPRMWGIALRNGTLDRNAGRNVKRSADVSGNARHFCDGELNYMIWERTLRTETLDRSNARDLEQVVRLLREVDVSPVSPSSTPRMWDIAPRNGRRPCEPEFNYMIREKAVRNESLENPSQCEGFGCGHYNLHKSLNPIRHCHIYSLQFWLLTRVPNTNSPLAFPAHLHYHRTNKKKEFSICTKIVFVAIINVFIPVWP